MKPRWHIAFSNMTYTEYAGVSYRDYYRSPAIMLEAQLTAKDFAERRFGAGRFISPSVDSPPCLLASFLGMPVIAPADADELMYLDTSRPVLTHSTQVDAIHCGDPRRDGLMAARWEAWQYYRSRGYRVPFMADGGEPITLACQISSGAALLWCAQNPEGMKRILMKLVTVEKNLAAFSAALDGREGTDFTYTGDDFSGLLSPRMYHALAVPCYRLLYGSSQTRFMHSELLRAAHLRIARDEVGITMFHGAGCANLALEELREIMGEHFWTQVTPAEMAGRSPAWIAERIRHLAQSGCSCVQIYPGRGTPVRTMEAAIAAARRECAGGPAWAPTDGDDGGALADAPI